MHVRTVVCRRTAKINWERKLASHRLSMTIENVLSRGRKKKSWGCLQIADRARGNSTDGASRALLFILSSAGPAQPLARFQVSSACLGRNAEFLQARTSRNHVRPLLLLNTADGFSCAILELEYATVWQPTRSPGTLTFQFAKPTARAKRAARNSHTD